MADENAGDKPGDGKPEAKAEGPRKPRGPVLLEAIFAGAQILTSVTGATVFATALFTGTPVATAVVQALVATATVGAVMWTVHWLVTHGLLAARKAELESEAADETAAAGTNLEVQA